MKRSYQKEMMDFAGNSPALLAEDLGNLRWLNRYLRGTRAVLFALQKSLLRDHGKPISVLDLGTGSADIPQAISAWSQRRGLAATIIGIDANPVTASIAAERSRSHAAIAIIQGDAGALPFAAAAVDYIVASQFLHHFGEARIVELLKAWAQVARRGIVISDLVRHPVAYHGIRLLTTLTTRNLMTRTDAPLSVRRACTLHEWRDLLHQADIGRVEMYSIFPFRMAALIRLGGGR